jgi:hypothetical protein
MRLRGKAVHQSNPAPLLRTALGFFPLSSRVFAKTEESKNKEHNDHGANDIDDSIHDPFSCACRGHISYKKTFSLARQEARLASARRPEYCNADKRSRALRINF